MRHLAVCLALILPAAALADDSSKPTAWTEKVLPLESVERVVMPPVDVEAYKAEDEQEALGGEKSLRFAASLKANFTPENAGTWERVGADRLMWRLRVYSEGAKSLNFGFSHFFMPPGGQLFVYSLDGKHVYRPFTAADNEEHGQLWTPPVFGDETVLEVTIPESEREALKLNLGTVNHDYRGFGQPNMEKSGACNIDIVCPIGDPFNDQDRAVAVISTGGSRFCTGSLLNNTANDAKPFFMTANHCGITSGNAPSLVTFWNYFNSTCRPQGGGQSPPGDGSLSQFNTGSIFRSSDATSDFTLVELDDPLAPAFNLFLAGWDRTPNPTQFQSPTGIHHPNTEEMRISFSLAMTVSGGWPPTVPGDGSHVKVFWGPNLGVTEPGSSGSPIYTQQKRFIGQLHGGASICGGADLTDFYGRFSESWARGNLAPILDPGSTGQITLDGRNACTFPSAPTGVTATATAPNTIRVAWTAVPGASSYIVLRAVGPCPQINYAPIATNVTGTTYDDTTVSGGITYAYVVRAVVSGCPSLDSNCDDAIATGACTLPPTFAGLQSVTSGGTSSCALNLSWAAATPTCPATTVKYNVYRSLTPGFTPGPANLRQSCLAGLAFQDTTVQSGTRYHYIVRAEDSSSNGTGACNSGVQDANLVERSSVPGGPSTTVTDDVESGNTFWSTAGGSGTNVWAIVTTQSNSPTHSWFVADPAVITDQRLSTLSAGNIPAGFVLSFFHRFVTESTFDGHVLEYSLDGGTTWTDILLGQGSVPANPNRFLQGAYNATISSNFGSPIGGRRAWSGNFASFQQVRVDMADFSGRDVMIRIRFASDNSVSATGVWVDDITYRFPGSCTTVPVQAVEPQALAVDAPGNRVLEAGETAEVAPTWRNTGSTAITLTGTASNFTGPAGPTYTITDNSASYGTIGVSGSGTCTTGGNCYGVSITGTRPAAHWDGTILETVTPTATTKTWTLHVGDSFTDVSNTSPFYRFVETLLHKGVTGGCGAGTYCPASSTTREQMAVFVLVAKEGAGYSPAACVPPNLFTDVPETSPFCRFIEELSNRGVVAGCGPSLYCPSAAVTREQMSVFVLRTLDGTLNPAACVAGSEMFADVPASSPFCRWIEELARRGVVTGCGGGNYCPADPVTREQMGVFLSATFGLALYGV